MSQRNGVVIVSWPRTGSTLLMGLLNAMPYTRVVGEWGNPFLDLSRSVEQMRKWKHIPNEEAGTRWPHFGIEKANPQGYAQDLAWVLRKQLLFGSDGPLITLGMKINVWTEARTSDFAPMTEMFRRTLGNDTLFITLTRTYADACASWGLGPEDMRMREFFEAWQRYASWLNTTNTPVFNLHYDELCETDTSNLSMTLADLFRVVMNREPTADQIGDLLEVVNTPHSSNPRTAQDTINRRIRA